MKITSMLGASVALVALANEARATPFTYSFNMPKWQVSQSAPIFGTNAVLDITVNNGSKSGKNQSYTFSEIQSLSVAAVGGSFAHTWTSASVISDTAPGNVFLLTDATGIPTLDLLVQNVSQRIYFRDLPISDVQLGITGPTGGFTTFDVAVGTFVDFTAYAITGGTFTCNIDCGLSVKGTPLTVARVPEPTPLSILGFAFLAGGIAGWRRTKAEGQP